MKHLAIVAVAVLALASCGADPEPGAEPQPEPSAGTDTTADEPEAETADEPTDEAPIEDDVAPNAGLPTWQEGDPANAWVCPTDSGEVIWFHVPLETDHEGIELVEQAREDAQIDAEPTYLVAHIDATQADEAYGVYEIAWAATDAKTVRAKPAHEAIGDWQDEIDIETSEGVDRYNVLVDAHNELIETKPTREAEGYVLFIVDGSADSMVAPQISSGLAAYDCMLEQYHE